MQILAPDFFKAKKKEKYYLRKKGEKSKEPSGHLGSTGFSS
jgi:hypothetical protein